MRLFRARHLKQPDRVAEVLRAEMRGAAHNQHSDPEAIKAAVDCFRFLAKRGCKADKSDAAAFLNGLPAPALMKRVSVLAVAHYRRARSA